MLNEVRVRHTLLFLLITIIVVSVCAIAQTPTPTGPIMRFTATTANVNGAGDMIKIDLLKWSTDAERDQLIAAWNLTAPAGGARGGAGRGAPGGAGAGGRGGGGRSAGNPDAGTPQAGAPQAGAPQAGAPAAAGQPAAGQPAAGANPTDAPAAAAAGGRGGRGGGRGGAAGAADAAPPTPERSLAAALQAGQTLGYLWSSESAGYSLKYAYRLKQPDGSERMIFATDRRLGQWNDLWKPSSGALNTNYEFSVIELRFGPKGDGEGKTSLSGKVVIDSTVNSIALDGYSSLPVVFKDVKRRSGT